MTSQFSLHKCLCIVSPLLIISGIGLILSGPALLTVVKDNYMLLTPNSQLYNFWKHLPFAIPVDFYFFNWTNPEDVYSETFKPKFRQVGPYRFLEDRRKSDVKWNNNGTVTFKHLKFWYYDNKDGNGNLEDEVTTINPTALTAVHVSRTWNYFVRKGLSLTLSRVAPTINMTRTVRQMLFEGYPDALMKAAKTMPFFGDKKLPPWDKFGWFYMRNGSQDYEGVYNMGTGTKSTLGRLYQWNYETKTPYYQGDCTKVSGSAGELFEPDKDTISMFSSDMCGTLVLKHAGKSKVENIIGYKYTAEDHMLDNGTIYPENKCLCNGECVPSGLVNVSPCRYGAPAFGSLPHFYNADPFYTNLVEGLQPDKSKHEFFITIEPTTGIPLEVNVRLQINLLLQSYPGISMYQNVRKVFFPMVWFDQKIKISSNEAFKLKLLLNIPNMSTSLGVLLIILGLAPLCYLWYKRYSRRVLKGEKKEYLPVARSAMS